MFLKKYEKIVNDFINNTSHFQMNDARQFPIIVPNKNQLSDFKYLFDNAVKIKKLQFTNQISKEETPKKLKLIQEHLHKLVYSLCNLAQVEKKLWSIEINED